MVKKKSPKLLRNHYVLLLDDTFYPMSGQTTVGAGLENALKRLSLNQDWANGKSLHRKRIHSNFMVFSHTIVLL